MNKTILTIFSLSVLSGCATQQPAPPPVVDKEPIIIGLPIQERLDKSSKVIGEQLALLNKVQSGRPIGAYSVVEHNNNLDARVGSKNTIPYAYAFQEEIKAKNEEAKRLEEERKKMLAILNTKVKSIEWKNNSANELAKQFAKALGYTLVLNPTTKDQNIHFTVQDVTVLEAIQKFQQLMLPIAEVAIIDHNKTVNVLYK